MIRKTGKAYYSTRSFQNLGEMLDQSVELFGELPAVRFRETPDQEPQSRTYNELLRDVQRMQQGLAALGQSPARIAVVGENSYGWMLAYLAAMTADSVIVPLDRLLKMEEIENLLVRGDVDVLFYDASFHEALVAALPRLPDLELAVPLQLARASAAAREKTRAALQVGRINQTEFHSFEELLERGGQVLAEGRAQPLTRLDPETPQALLFTSGTTATSKGVLLSQRALSADVLALAGVVRFEPGFRSLSILPLHHAFENTCGFLTVLYFGGCIHIADGLRYIQKNLAEYGVNMVIGVPTLFENFYAKVQAALVKEKKTRLVSVLRRVVRFFRFFGLDLRRRVFGQILASFGGHLHTAISGAAALDPDVIQFFDDIGIRILQGYGLTETAPVAAGCNDFVFSAGSVGHPLAGIEIAIDSENESEPGEILIRGPILMNGYYKDEAATREAIDEEGWFHSGDLGLINKDGFLTITGRLKSMIVLASGKKVFPEEIESLINRHDYVKDSLVYAQDDGRGDVVVTARVVFDEEGLAREGGTLTVAQRLEQLIQEVNRSLPSFKNVRSYFYSFRDMVRTTTLKVKRAVEIKYMADLVKKHELRWRELTGKNIDELTEAPIVTETAVKKN